MNKWSRLAGVPFVSLLLIGGLFASMQIARADLERRPTLAIPEPVATMREPAETLATTLTLDIPDFGMQRKEIDGSRGHKVLDLWNYTTYDGDLVSVVYTATQLNNYLVFEIVSGHYLSMTATTIFKKTEEMTVGASDGEIEATDTFSVMIGSVPQIVFYYVPWGYSLDDPLCIEAGKSLEEPIDLGHFAVDEYDTDEELTFSIVSVTPPDLGLLGLSIYTDTGDCYHCLDISPAPESAGTFQVEVQVQNTSYLTDTAAFTVSVQHKIYLPLVLRNHYSAPMLQPIDNPDGDGDYTLEWLYASSDPVSYDVEFSLNDPLFTSPELGSSGSTSVGSLFNWSGVTQAGTHYWRVRAYSYSTEEYTPWSNVQSTSVSQFAYLVADNESYAFDLTIEIEGNGISDSTIYSPRTYGYWRSFPVGAYTFRITNELCHPDTRTQKVTLTNAGAGGAWYRIPMCDPITGPHPNPYP